MRARAGAARATGVILRFAAAVVVAGLALPVLESADGPALRRGHGGADVAGLRDVPRGVLATSLASADDRSRSADRGSWAKTLAAPVDVVALASLLLAGTIGLAALDRARLRPGLGASSRSPPLLRPV